MIKFEEMWCNKEKFIEGETWKTCKDADNYEVSNYGRIRCLSWTRGSYYKKEDYPIIMSQHFDAKGYCVSNLRNNNGVGKLIRVHRYVGFAFIDNLNNLPQINHMDGIKTRNNVENLEWSTNDDNMRHSYAIGLRETSSRGENNGRSIITEKDVIYIYTNPDRKTITELRKQFKLEQSSINSIYKGKNWRYITKDLEPNPISSNDRFFKCSKDGNIFYFDKIEKTRVVTNLSKFKTMQSIYDKKEYNGWTIYYCTYDEYKLNKKEATPPNE